jgi:hypothetical protein
MDLSCHLIFSYTSVSTRTFYGVNILLTDKCIFHLHSYVINKLNFQAGIHNVIHTYVYHIAVRKFNRILGIDSCKLFILDLLVLLICRWPKRKYAYVPCYLQEVLQLLLLVKSSSNVPAFLRNNLTILGVFVENWPLGPTLHLSPL